MHNVAVGWQVVCRAVLFDLMGTLLLGQTGGSGDHAYQRMYERLCRAGMRLGRARFDAVYAATPAVAVEPPLTPFAHRLQRVCAQGSLTLDAAAAHRLADAVCAYSAQLLQLDARAQAVLDELRAAIGPLGLVTNYDHPPNIHHLLQRVQRIAPLKAQQDFIFSLKVRVADGYFHNKAIELGFG